MVFKAHTPIVRYNHYHCKWNKIVGENVKTLLVGLHKEGVWHCHIVLTTDTNTRWYIASAHLYNRVQSLADLKPVFQLLRKSF